MNAPEKPSELPALVVFDLAGTVLDFGCRAPVAAFVRAFERGGVSITVEEARGPMGLNKIDHVRTLFQLPRVQGAFQEGKGRPWSEEDVNRVYEDFLPLQAESARAHAALIDGVPAVCAWLARNGIAYAATTGYPRAIAAPILEHAASQGFLPEATFCADEVPAGRPAPWLLHRCMESCGVFPAPRVIKVGDTVPDVSAARNALVRAVAVTESSSEIGLSEVELGELLEPDRSRLIAAAEAKFLAAGADAVLPTVADLPRWLERGLE